MNFSVVTFQVATLKFQKFIFFAIHQKSFPNQLIEVPFISENPVKNFSFFWSFGNFCG